MEWKQIKGFDGLYELRNDGLLHCFKKKGCHKDVFTYGYDNGKGYLRFHLSKNNKSKMVEVSHLVYQTFVGDIPNGYDIHHKNGNSKDNRVENLELIEEKIHSRLHYPDKMEQMIKKSNEIRSKTIQQYTLDGEFVNEYKSSNEASRQTNISQGNISMCCNGKRKSAGGSIWKYKEAS